MSDDPHPAIEESDAAVRHAHDVRMQFLAGLVDHVGHELNNLFTSILGCLGILDDEQARDPAGSRTRVLIADAVSASREGLELMDKLRACVGRQALVPERIAVDGLIADLSGLLGQTLPAGIVPELRSAAGLPAVRADRRRLEAALLDLVVNACEAMPDGGRLGLAAEAVALSDDHARRFGGIAAGRYVRFEVSDTGAGVGAEAAARIYDPFFSTRSPSAGRGLGLSMAFGFARQSGGGLAVAGREGPGTAVRVLMPVWDDTGRRIA